MKCEINQFVRVFHICNKFEIIFAFLWVRSHLLIIHLKYISDACKFVTVSIKTSISRWYLTLELIYASNRESDDFPFEIDYHPAICSINSAAKNISMDWRITEMWAPNINGRRFYTKKNVYYFNLNYGLRILEKIFFSLWFIICICLIFPFTRIITIIFI